MRYSQSDIPEKLEIGKAYTDIQLVAYMLEHKNTVIVSKTRSNFNGIHTHSQKVLECIEGYTHFSERQSYTIPTNTQTYYIVE